MAKQERGQWDARAGAIGGRPLLVMYSYEVAQQLFSRCVTLREADRVECATDLLQSQRVFTFATQLSLAHILLSLIHHWPAHHP